MFAKSNSLPSKEQALSGRESAMPVTNQHFINQHPIQAPFPKGIEVLIVGMGCFWGAEKSYWQLDGVYSTAVGYSAGHTPNPTYQEVCSGQTAHNEVVLIAYDAQKISLELLLKNFWEGHNPTQGMRQGNDKGTQYRSGIYCTAKAQYQQAQASKIVYQKILTEKGYGAITTEILMAQPFYYAEDFHQQYLAKNPAGYCGLGGITGAEYTNND
ncbi:MAG TPA: peptide-methionine (S)-S-oxide reductase MsrA [Leucothrix mucor]|uniref:Peptide methionine sulfoxide reductase MsrA n=1 Tax=Leucothrix mucor TaxID=45248 RepID=A0A7V2SXF3_LEUMU|nr:peptide-methionine (S)-S-oxide reductase MsrA [Leucothrix mucor]